MFLCRTTKEMYLFVTNVSPMSNILEFTSFLYTLTLIGVLLSCNGSYSELQQTNLISSLQAFVNAYHFWPNHCESTTWWSFRSSMHRWGNKKDMAVSFGLCHVHFWSVSVWFNVIFLAGRWSALLICRNWSQCQVQRSLLRSENQESC